MACTIFHDFLLYNKEVSTVLSTKVVRLVLLLLLVL